MLTQRKEVDFVGYSDEKHLHLVHTTKMSTSLAGLLLPRSNIACVENSIAN